MESMTPKPEQPNEEVHGFDEVQVEEMFGFMEEVTELWDARNRWESVTKLQELFE